MKDNFEYWLSIVTKLNITVHVDCYHKSKYLLPNDTRRIMN